jgi:hypothetical protein
MKRIVKAGVVDVIAILIQIALVLANNKFGWGLSVWQLAIPSLVYGLFLVCVWRNLFGIRLWLVSKL